MATISTRSAKTGSRAVQAKTLTSRRGMAPSTKTRGPRAIAGASRLYSCRAMARDGAVESGSLEATSESEVAASLTRRGLFPLEVRSRGSVGGRRAPASAADLALGLRILADLL